MPGWVLVVIAGIIFVFVMMWGAPWVSILISNWKRAHRNVNDPLINKKRARKNL